jgi:hypothetical protein
MRRRFPPNDVSGEIGHRDPQLLEADLHAILR